MEINQIRYFVETCNQSSMAKAAESLHITQQGISVAIRKLEEELQCVLFYRKWNGLVLTEAGRIFKAEAEEILRHVNNIYEPCGMKSAGKTHICIAITQSLIVRLPIELQQVLINGNSEYDVKLIEDYSASCARMVQEKQAQFGIIYGSCDESKFNVTHLDTVEQVLIVSKDSPLAEKDVISLRDLDDYPMVLPDRFSYPRLFMAQLFEQAGLRLNIAYECNRPRQTIDVISNNPKLAARTIAAEINDHDLNRIKVLELDGHSLDLTVNLITRKGYNLNAKERLFKHMIMDSYRKEL